MINFKRVFISLLLSIFPLWGSLKDKSAIVYYGKDISYSMVGIHDYIIVQPDSINVNRHGFELYKKKMYAYVSIGEIHSGIKEYKDIKKEWVLATNKSWGSEVLDIKNREYQNFLFEKMIDPLLEKGFQNFFFDTLDSYQLVSKNAEEREENEEALAEFINTFHKKYPQSKLIINRGFEIIERVHNSVNAVLFESYYSGIGGKDLAYKEVSDADREWLDIHIENIQSYGLDVISVEYKEESEIENSDDLVEKLLEKNMIPYISNRDLDIYGKSSKSAIKREVFTLIDVSRYDKTLQGAHQYGALPLEYMGYIQKLYDVHKKLPSMNEMRHYAGVIVWLRDYYKNSNELMQWLEGVRELGIKIAFASNFGVSYSSDDLKRFDIQVANNMQQRIKILEQSKMIGYEMPPSLNVSYIQISTKESDPLLVFENSDKTTATVAAITPWGGYAVEEAFMSEIDEQNIWVINPFEFFKKALRLKTILVPDSTTENGKRLFFTHADGDAIMNKVEGERDMLSGESILKNILKPYDLPHSISIVGAEIDKNGLFPKLSERLTKTVKEIYALPYVEGATHTYSHPFFWGKINNDNLEPQYRLNVKDYNFSINREIGQSLDEINNVYSPQGKKKSKTVFWSGDCLPRINALSYVYKHHLLNINGGDTVITNVRPWLSNVAPQGVERGGYYQIYTGAENENVFTNDWHGPFWGYKKVIQTFSLTNSPKRLKPIDIYYHFYSGSKIASLHALQDVFEWVLKQDVMPIYTSEFIPKVMDYYEVSEAYEDGTYLVAGMKNLRTLRIEKPDAAVDMEVSPSVIGIRHFEGHTYIALSPKQEAYVKLAQESNSSSYLVSANAPVKYYKNSKKIKKFYFDGYVDLALQFYADAKCSIMSRPEAIKKYLKDGMVILKYREQKRALVTVKCEEFKNH